MDGNLKNRHFFTPDVNKSVVNTVAVYYKYMYVTVSILTGSNRRTFTAFSGTGCHLNLILYIQHTHASSTSFHTKYGGVGLKSSGQDRNLQLLDRQLDIYDGGAGVDPRFECGNTGTSQAPKGQE